MRKPRPEETITMPDPTLTDDELTAATRAGMTPEKYAEMKGVRTLDDWQALQRRRRDDEEHEHLKAAIHKALDERDAGA
jgi:hypothetical protein